MSSSGGGSYGGGSGSGGSGGGGGNYPGNIRALYGVWIDQALKKNDPNELKTVLQEARKHFPVVAQPLYASHIHFCLESGNASRQELEQLLSAAKETKNSDLDGAIKKLEAHLGSSKK